MNRNIEWQNFVADVKSSFPTQIDSSAQRAVCSVKSRFRMSLLIKAPVSAFFAIIVIFIALVNASAKFSKAMQAMPLLCRLVRLVTVNPHLRTSIRI